MRLFSALVPPADVLDQVESIVAPLRRDTRVRWMPREDWHITTSFFGEVDSAASGTLLEELGWAAERSPLDALRLANGTEFHGKALVLEVSGDTEGLGELARRSNRAGQRAGLDLPHRRFRPHLTIARSNRPRDLSALVSQLLGRSTSSWIPSELVLMESRRTGDLRYHRVAHWSLG